MLTKYEIDEKDLEKENKSKIFYKKDGELEWTSMGSTPLEIRTIPTEYEVTLTSIPF